MAKIFPLNPKHPERICWGCDKYCPAGSLGCGNGSGRTQHPAELLGDDWYTFGEWGIETGIKTGVETGIETGIAAGIAAGIEAGIEAGVETGVETGVESGIAPVATTAPNKK